MKCILLILCLLPFWVSSQDLKIYAKLDGDTSYFTWVNKSAEDWRKSTTYGYKISIFNQDGEKIVVDTIFPKLLKYKDLPIADEGRLLYELAYNKEVALAIYGSDVYEKADREEVEEELYETFYFTACKDRKLLRDAGFLFSYDLDKNQTYNVSLALMNDVDRKVSSSITFVPSEYKAPELPELSSKWKSKRVDLSWSHQGYTDVFNFYDVYFSKDGQSWMKTDSTIVNFSGEESHPDLLLNSVVKQVPHNDSTYWFKLHGIDFFGDRTKAFSIVKGSASKGIQVSPYWISIQQLRSNEAHLKWNIPEAVRPEVQEYRIYVSEYYDGPYIPDTIGISPSIFEMKRRIPFKSAYFRIIAVDKNQEEFASFPQLIVGVDTLAPAVPVNLKYEIDTTGILNITWDENDEEDFIGYKLFYCYDTTVDMTLAHNNYLGRPAFKDTLELKTTNREVYYKAIAVDRRNNRSEFSEVLVVTKPDVLAPVEPVFLEAKGGPASASLIWYKSISDDVAEQRLFRKKIADGQWDLIEVWDSVIDTTFEDKELEALQKYVYTLQVIDRAGNESDPSRPVMVMPTPDYRGFDLERWRISVDDEEVLIEHDYELNPEDRVLIYRRKEGESLYSIGEFEEGEQRFTDPAIEKGRSYQYALKVVFREGIETPLSGFKEVGK